MEAQQIISRKIDAHGGTAHIRVMKLPRAIAGLSHSFKYSLAFVVDGECVVLYDVHPGKSDHKHIRGVETGYTFNGIEQLLTDFWADVEKLT